MAVSCRHCGKTIPDNARVCPFCGYPIVTAPATGPSRPVSQAARPASPAPAAAPVRSASPAAAPAAQAPAAPSPAPQASVLSAPARSGEFAGGAFLSAAQAAVRQTVSETSAAVPGPLAGLLRGGLGIVA